MQETRYGLKVSLPVPYHDALARATEALKAQGFGILTTIDVQQTLKAKLDRAFRKYVILGACNPPLADRALRADLEVGLLLPCNVIVYGPDQARASSQPWRHSLRWASSVTIVISCPSRRKPTSGSEVLSRRLKDHRGVVASARSA
jgi:uncharacterized protein (DUF302 family)